MSQKELFQRRSLDQITNIPERIISVYVVERHIWADGGADTTWRARQAETRTVEEFLIDPVRPFLNDIFRQMAAPYLPARKDNPIGQGYWIQAEFGSGKSHLVSFIGALALGGEKEWEIVREKEREAGLGRRESLYNFYENGLARKTKESKGIFVAVKTLVGQGGGAIGIRDSHKTLTEYVLDAVAEQFARETGQSLPFYPTQILAERFLNTADFERYRHDLAKFLRDPSYFDEEEQEDINDFLDDLQNNPDPGIQRDCGQRLWDFYEKYLKIRPQIPMETEEVLKHMVQRILEYGYAGLLLILDEMSLFMKERSDTQRADDEKTLVVLSNRLAKVENLPVWTICTAQQAIESKMMGVKNIIARERLDLVPLLNKQDYYYDIALARVREVTEPTAVDRYYEDYKRSFSWPEAVGRDEFARFFPFYPPSIDLVRTVSYNLTTVRSALYFMLQTLKTQRKKQSRELVTLWSLFDDVVEYEEDPSGTTRGIAAVKTKWPDEWKAYESARHQLDMITKGPLKVYRSRCEKIIKTLFLYHVADTAPNGLSLEDLMNNVMEWKDHDKEQTADLQDNLDHYEILTDTIARELAQVSKVGTTFRFNPTGGGTDPREHFQRARAEAEQDEVLRRQAWEALLALDGWQVTTNLVTLDLASGLRSIFRDIAPDNQKDITLKWHGREITGRVFMRDLLGIARRNGILPTINSAETGLDYHAFISNTPAMNELNQLVEGKKDGRVLFWSPDALTQAEQSLLADFTAYRTLVGDFRNRDTEEARVVLNWVQERLRDQMGTIYRIVPDSYGRGRLTTLDHSRMSFEVQGELPAILAPLVQQVLDTVYESKELAFTAPAPFKDTNAINVINGIVKVGEIPRGARPDKDISAAQNYGFDLRIMRRPNDKKLDISECPYTADMFAFIQEKLGDTSTAMPIVTLYKNFMGIGGPGGRNYGLSRRIVQLYLLCLVQQGKVRLSLTGRRVPVEAIDYSNIATVDFKVAVLDAIEQIQLLKPPEGWETLAPFAALLLEDDSLREAKQEADIQDGVRRLLAYKKEQLPEIEKLRARLADLFAEIKQPNLFAERLAAWETFLASPVGDPADPLPFLRHALDKAFAYQVYESSLVSQADVDDFASRLAEIRQAQAFYKYQHRLRTVARYVGFEVPEQAQFSEVQKAFINGEQTLAKLDGLARNETRLIGELLEPVEKGIQTYTVYYLNFFDQVTAHTERIRQQLRALPEGVEYRALGQLAHVPQLGSDPRPALQKTFAQSQETLFPAELTRADLERTLREWPQPPGSPLTLENAGDWLQTADDALNRCRQAIQDALMEKAALLHSDALHERLIQGVEQTFMARLLENDSATAVAGYLAQTLGRGSEGAAEAIAILQRYLKKIQVRKVRLTDFAPSKRTLETADIDTVVTEFRVFLQESLASDDDELPVIELE